MKDNAMGTKETKRASTGNGAGPDFRSWMSGTNHALEDWTRSGAEMMKGAVEITQEIMTFSQNLLQADIDAWKALTACRNPGEFFECQKQFAEKATAQYLDEANKITSRIIGVMSGASARFQSEPEHISKS